MEKHPTICNICGGKVVLIKTGSKNPRSDYIYKCLKCNATVGTHPNTKDALGFLGNEQTKAKRKEIHLWFDRLYQRHNDREQLYYKLAAELGIEKEQCHFSQMSDEMLDKSLEIVKKWWWEKYDK